MSSAITTPSPHTITFVLPECRRRLSVVGRTALWLGIALMRRATRMSLARRDSDGQSRVLRNERERTDRELHAAVELSLHAIRV